jgi:hypothetical protein
MTKKALNWAKNHRISLVFGCIAAAGLGYYALRSDGTVRHISLSCANGCTSGACNP